MNGRMNVWHCLQRVKKAVKAEKNDKSVLETRRTNERIKQASR